VQLTAHVAQPFDQGAFDVGVNVFELDGECEVAALDFGGNVVESGANPRSLVGVEKAWLATTS
jgi:hypothetical protein